MIKEIIISLLIWTIIVIIVVAFISWDKSIASWAIEGRALVAVAWGAITIILIEDIRKKNQ